MSQHQLVVIVGSSGVGKSTLARALQEELLPDPWLHFSVDTIFYCLPRSVVLRVDEVNDRSSVDSRAIVAGAYACAMTLLRLGHRIVYDAVVLSENGAREMIDAFAAFDPVLIELTCQWPEIQRRTLARGDRTLAEAEYGYKNAHGHLTPHLVFDSTYITAEKIAADLANVLRGESK
jgi:chloramphenicol 3-O phosphotransferase